jgi:hypothetical protein
MNVSVGKKGLLLIAAGAAGMIAAGTGVAYATGAIGSASPSVIVGCAKNANGQLRVVGNPSECNPSEHSVAFAAPRPQPGPTFTNVDCGAGQSVQQAINEADPTQPLTVSITGICVESVNVTRDDVTLRSSTPGSGIQAPAGAFAAVSLNNARSINLNQLALSGGNSTLSETNNSSLSGFDLRISGAHNTGIDVGLGSSAQLNNPAVDSAGQNGIQAHAGGAATIVGGTISNSGAFGIGAQGGSVGLFGGVTVSHSGQIGVYAAFGGTIDANGLTVDGSTGTGVMANEGGAIHLNGSNVLIENSGQQGISANNNGAIDVSNGTRVIGNGQGGIFSYDSSAVQVEGAIVENNSGSGVSIVNASSAEIHDSTISGNGGDGVHVSDTSVVQFGFPSGNNIITGNGGWGVRCDHAPSVALIKFLPGTVTGNAQGQLDCPTG